jgi:hypothetical protein
MTPEALKQLCPTAAWALDGDEIHWEQDTVTKQPVAKNLTWYSKDVPMPTKREIDAEIERLIQKFRDEEYRRLRAPEYPYLTEFADAYYWERRGDPSKMTEYLAKVDAVKAKYLKGEKK